MTRRGLTCGLIGHKPAKFVWAILNAEVPGFVFDGSTDFLIKDVLVRPCMRCGVWMMSDASPRGVDSPTGQSEGVQSG